MLSECADCDVYVMDHEEPEAVTLQIGTRGMGLMYPFTRTEVAEGVKSVETSAVRRFV